MVSIRYACPPSTFPSLAAVLNLLLLAAPTAFLYLLQAYLGISTQLRFLLPCMCWPAVEDSVAALPFPMLCKIDACSANNAGGHDATRKMKNELLVQMEGCTSGSSHVMLIGATNVPEVCCLLYKLSCDPKLYIVVSTTWHIPSTSS